MAPLTSPAWAGSQRFKMMLTLKNYSITMTLELKSLHYNDITT